MTDKTRNRKWLTVLQHVGVWLFMMIISSVLSPERLPEKKLIIAFQFALVGLFYLNARFIYPRFLRGRRWPWHLLGILVIYLLVISVLFLLRGETDNFFEVVRGTPAPSVWIIGFFPTQLIYFSSLAYILFSERQQAERDRLERESENMKTELALLRSQVSPHFMFNVLNSLVALARKKSDDLEPSLLRLSELMRYMIYESESGLVTLKQEVDYLNSYIELQRMRFAQKTEINTQFTINTSSEEELAPMLLIPFIENAFKHGLNTGTDSSIQITLTSHQGVLDLQVRNRLAIRLEQRDESSGIGLPNVRRRLELLYPDRHTLQISDGDGWFHVHLQLRFK